METYQCWRIESGPLEDWEHWVGEKHGFDIKARTIGNYHCIAWADHLLPMWWERCGGMIDRALGRGEKRRVEFLPHPDVKDKAVMCVLVLDGPKEQ